MFKMTTIFFSVADKSQDRNLFQELLKHLSVQKRQDRIEELYDSLIDPGSTRNDVILTFIRRAHIIVLLITPDFFHSNQCVDVELHAALEQHRTTGAQILPVLLRPTEWEGFSFGQSHLLPLLPPNGLAVSSWKNLDEALLEVTKGIRRAINALTRPSDDPPPPIQPVSLPLWTLPYRRNPVFTDRKEILTELHQGFTSGQNIALRMQTLHGSEGVGKTAIAVEYACRFRYEYQAILWLNTSSPELLSANLVTLTDQLGSSPHDGSDTQQRIATVRQWLRQHEKWLVILDNLEDFHLINQLLPLQGNGHVLLITATQATEEFLSPILVPQISADEGALLLLRRAQLLSERASRIAASESMLFQASAIVRAVASSSLALDQAGAYIKETHCSLSSYLQRYRRHQWQARLFARYGWFVNNRLDPTPTTLLLTLKKIAQINPQALKLVQFFAFLHPDTLANEMIRQGTSSLAQPLSALTTNPHAFNEALALLQHFSLVHLRADSTTMYMHRIVQALIRKTLSNTQQKWFANQAISLINSTFPEVHFATWEKCQRYLPQALHCSTLLQDFRLTLKEGGLLLERLGFYYYQRGCYDEANSYLTQALRFQEHHHPGNPLDLAQTLNSLGLLAQRQARYQDAKVLHQRALELYEREPDHPQIGESLHNLAVLYEHEGQYHQAEQFYLRVLSLDERAGRSDNPDAIKTLNNLALMYYLQGDYAQAKMTYQRVLTTYERSQFPQDPTLAYTLNGLGALAEKYGENQQAAAFYQRALAIREQALGKEHSETAHSINKSAHIYELQGNYQHAYTLYEQAVAIGRKALGPEHPDIALFLNNLAFLAQKQGQYQHAEALYQQALNIYELTSGTERVAVAQVLTNLGQLYHTLQNMQRAEAFLYQALAIREHLLDITDHPDTAQILSHLGALFIDQHRYAEAEPVFQRALAILRQKPGLIYPETTRVQEIYASLLERLQRNEEATRLRQPEAEHDEEQSPQGDDATNLKD
jgi:tetratricopeptide (TPR) repeat protein